MAKLGNIIAGLEIARKYVGDKSYSTAAEHDQFFLYPIKGLSAEDAERLEKLDWLQEGRDEGEPFNPEDGWYIFT